LIQLKGITLMCSIT